MVYWTNVGIWTRSMDVAMERLVKRHMASWGFSREQALNQIGDE